MTRKTIVLVGALLMVASACTTTGDAADADAIAAPALTPTTGHTPAVSAPDESDTTSEGIQVHGHWTIEVRNPDGSVAERRQFQNALVGDNVLNGLLVGGWSDPRDWAILLGSREIMAATDTHGGNIVLAGSATPSSVETFNQVGTQVTVTVATHPFDMPFTETSVAPVTVEANQTVYVEVRISFS